MNFESYLIEKGIQEPNLEDGAKKLEHLLSKAVLLINPNASPNLFKGVIWQNGSLNPFCSTEDVEKALGILRTAVLRTKAQGLVDQFDVEEFETQQPSAVKFAPTGEDTKLETGDPLDSQQIGRSTQVLPEEVEEGDDPDTPKVVETSVDDRVYELLKISGNF